ncbi:EF-P 5-aminopentanol modification-associated protein YfmF [Brevibacillus reuszeri]|uniref:EF-P 5-aminopentanol modification-associated protein YfmF n=1 Tax=Brevibacillus reuszeri TaxID=54915 RepID=UPI00289762C3|nr:pitrilysin family protein [Brevibacillus reuszeri]
MIGVIEHVIKLKNVCVHLIPIKKFKTVRVELKYKAPIERNTITKRAVLTSVLSNGSKKYPSKRHLQEKLDDLYGAYFKIDGFKAGTFHVLNVNMEFANRKYINDQSTVSSNALAFLNEVISHPNVENDAFDEVIVKREKETIRQYIRSIKDNKTGYAQMRLIDEMCQGEPYQIHHLGYEEDLDLINGKNLYEYYRKLLLEETVDLFVVGDFDYQAMETAIKENMADIIKTPIGRPVYPQEVSSKKFALSDPREIIEKEPIQQAKLHIGYRTNTTFRDSDFAGMLVCNMILGGYSGSKLFVHVREKNSLAYYVNSRWDLFSDKLFVNSGIAPSDYEKAREIIEEQLKAMKKGDISEMELKEAKTLLVGQYRKALDGADSIIDLLYQQELMNKALSTERIIEQIQQVQLDDVVRNANKIQADTIYLLTGEDVL